MSSLAQIEDPMVDGCIIIETRTTDGAVNDVGAAIAGIAVGQRKLAKNS